MKHKTTLLLAPLAAPALLAFTLPLDPPRSNGAPGAPGAPGALGALGALGATVEKVAFAPKEGTKVKKTFVTSGSFDLEDMSFLMNGEDPGGMPEMEMTTSWSQTVKVTDEYAAMGEGRPAKLVRTFDELGQEIDLEITVDMGESQDNSNSGSGSSDLEGETVVFAWDAEEEDFTKAFAEGSDADEDLLEGLVEDMDLRGLLPDGPVSEGDSWDIELTSLVHIMAPGGDLGIDVEIEGLEGAGMGGPDPNMMSNFNEILGDLLEGDATAKFTGTREVDGKRVGVIEVSLDITAASDLTDLMEEMMSDEMPEGLEVSFDSMDLDFTFEGTGELLWNLEGGHVHAFQLSGEVSMAMEMAFSITMGEEMDMEVSMEMSGTVSQKVETE